MIKKKLQVLIDKIIVSISRFSQRWIYPLFEKETKVLEEIVYALRVIVATTLVSSLVQLKS